MQKEIYFPPRQILFVREVTYDPNSLSKLRFSIFFGQRYHLHSSQRYHLQRYHLLLLLQRYHLHSSLRSRLFWPSPDIARIEISEEGRAGLSLKGPNYFSISRRSTRCRKNPPPRPLFSPRTLYFALHTNSFKTQRSVGADSIFVIRIQWSLITSRGDKG